MQCDLIYIKWKRIHGWGLKEFFLAVAKTVLSATMKYAAAVATKKKKEILGLMRIIFGL